MLKVIALVAVGTLCAFVAERPMPAAVVGAEPLAGPDYWIAIGRERDLQFSRTEYVRQNAIDVGNTGSSGQQQQLASMVVSQDGRDICSMSKAISPPGSRKVVSPLALEVVYAAAIDPGPANRRVAYKLVATISPAADDLPNEDQNPANNRIEVELRFPPGGKPRCVQMDGS